MSICLILTLNKINQFENICNLLNCIGNYRFACKVRVGVENYEKWVRKFAMKGLQ